MKKTFFEADIDIKLLTAAESLLLDASNRPGNDNNNDDDDDGWLPGIW